MARLPILPTDPFRPGDRTLQNGEPETREAEISVPAPPPVPPLSMAASGDRADLPLPPERPALPRRVGFIDLDPPPLNAPVGRPEGFSVTPGAADVDHGSDAPTDRPAWLSSLGAAFRQDNTVGAFFANDLPSGHREPGFNVWDRIRGTALEARWEQFTDIFNSRDFDLRVQRLDQQDEDRRTLAAAPWWQRIPSEMLAGFFDLPTLIPGGAFVRSARGGFAVGRSALNVGIAAGVSSSVQEAGLQALVETRTWDESAMNIGASVMIGGLLGAGGAALLSPAEWRAATQALERDLANAGAPRPARAGSVGAAADVAPPISDNAIAGRAASAVAGATARLNPILRLLNSPSAETRDVAVNLIENSLYLRKNFENVASEAAVETLMKEWNAGLARAISESGGAWDEFRKAGGALTRTEFQEAVGRAMRRADRDADPHIQRAAESWRREVFDPLKDAAIKAGLLPADVTVETATSYFTRMWSRNRLIAREDEFKGVVQQWVEENAPGWARAFDKSVERALDPLRLEIRDLETDKLRRASELQARENAGEIDAGEFSEADIRNALRIVRGGAPRPKGVETLTQFVHREGGLVDFQGELAHYGINNKARPGFVRARARKRGPLGWSNDGWRLDDMARHAWENGYFPKWAERPTVDDFVLALSDDFNKTRAVIRDADRDAFKLTELVEQLKNDLARVGAMEPQGPRFSTTEDVKGMVSRVFAAMDAQADAKIARLKAELAEREFNFRAERESRFVGDPKNLGREIANEVFDKLTGKTVEGVRPEFITIKARGPLKERTFNIPDEMVEDFLESNVELVGRRYARVMGADVEMKMKFGSVDLLEQIQKIRDEYRGLRAEAAHNPDGKKTAADIEKAKGKLDAAEKRDIGDLEALRDLLRGTRRESPVEENYGRLARAFNHVNYLRSMGEVVLASMTDVVRPAMVHGLTPYLGSVKALSTNIEAVRMSVKEAQLAGNVLERVLSHRLATVSDIMDPYAARGPVEAMLENLTNVASKWNGIRLWTDGMKSMTSVMTQNRILRNVQNAASLKASERAYMRYLGIGEDMEIRIHRMFDAHGRDIDGVLVANTEKWTDEWAAKAYRAAINKDVDSIIVHKSVADVPLFASTPTGKMILQFKSFALASHQKVLLRGLQENQARFVGGIVAMTAMGMMITWLKAVSGNRPEVREKALNNPGWWIGEGFDRAGIMAVPMEFANIFEKATGLNPLKSPLRAFDEQGSISQKNQNRNLMGSLLGPTAGLVEDVGTVAGIPRRLLSGEEVSQGQKRAAVRLLPFNSYLGIRQMMDHVIAPPQGR